MIVKKITKPLKIYQGILSVDAGTSSQDIVV